MGRKTVIVTVTFFELVISAVVAALSTLIYVRPNAIVSEFYSTDTARLVLLVLAWIMVLFDALTRWVFYPE